MSWVCKCYRMQSWTQTKCLSCEKPNPASKEKQKFMAKAERLERGLIQSDSDGRNVAPDFMAGVEWAFELYSQHESKKD